MTGDIIIILMAVWFASLSFTVWWFRPSPLFVGVKLLDFDFDITSSNDKMSRRDAKIIKNNKLIFHTSSMIVFFSGLLFLFMIVVATKILLIATGNHDIAERSVNRVTILSLGWGMIILAIIVSFFRKYKKKRWF
jgi:hypothetical protein